MNTGTLSYYYFFGTTKMPTVLFSIAFIPWVQMSVQFRQKRKGYKALVLLRKVVLTTWDLLKQGCGEPIDHRLKAPVCCVLSLLMWNVMILWNSSGSFRDFWTHSYAPVMLLCFLLLIPNLKFLYLLVCLFSY